MSDLGSPYGSVKGEKLEHRGKRAETDFIKNRFGASDRGVQLLSSKGVANRLDRVVLILGDCMTIISYLRTNKRSTRDRTELRFFDKA
jgi:preprotein translocase subunit SecG